MKVIGWLLLAIGLLGCFLALSASAMGVLVAGPASTKDLYGATEIGIGAYGIILAGLKLLSN